MTAIVLFSLPADFEKAKHIAGALSESGLDIFWFDWTNETKAVGELENCRCAIFLWSKATLAPEVSAFHTLALLAMEEGKAILLRTDAALPPADLQPLTTYDVRGWRARQSSLFMLDIVAAARSKAAGIDPPLQRAPRQLLFDRMKIAVPSAIAAIALIAGLYRDFGIDRFASPEEETAWNSLTPGSCKDLRDFRDRFPNGVHYAQAIALLGAPELVDKKVEGTDKLTFDQHEPHPDDRHFDTEAAARIFANDAMAVRVKNSCDEAGDTLKSKALSATFTDGRYDCERYPRGFTCSLMAKAVCIVDAPRIEKVEVCGSRVRNNNDN